MIYCEYCGQGMDENDSYCPNCHAPAPAHVTASSYAEPVAEPDDDGIDTVSTGSGEYSVALESLGTCDTSRATDIFRKALGYSIIESQKLIDAIPTDCAENLSKEQATYIAQALTEYGMEVTVLKNGQYEDVSGNAVESIFDGAGTLLKAAVAVFAGLTAFNRKNSFFSYKKPAPSINIFHPSYLTGQQGWNVRPPQNGVFPGGVRPPQGGVFPGGVRPPQNGVFPGGVRPPQGGFNLFRGPGGGEEGDTEPSGKPEE